MPQYFHRGFNSDIEVPFEEKLNWTSKENRFISKSKTSECPKEHQTGLLVMS